jgi:gliding motility-associated-like protein
MKNILIILIIFCNIQIYAQSSSDSTGCRIYSNLSDYWHLDTLCVGDTAELYWIPDKSFPDDTRFFVKWFPDVLHNPPVFRIISDTYQTFDTTIPNYPVRGRFVFDSPTIGNFTEIASRCGPTTGDTTFAYCQLSKSFVIRACPPEARIRNAQEVCKGDCVRYESTSRHSPRTWKWTFQGGNPSTYIGSNPPDICYTTAGIYTTKLVVSNLSGADSTLTTVRVFDTPQGGPATDAHTLKSHDTLTLSACVEGLYYKWLSATGLSCTTCHSPLLKALPLNTTYTCMVHNGSEKCAVLCTYPITIERGNYYIPNTFTPNGDGHNDIFSVYASDAIVNIKKMQIFDRWGEAVFAANNLPSFGGAGGGWDGTFKGQPAITDVYVYVIVLEFADGTTETVSGDVTLLR